MSHYPRPLQPCPAEGCPAMVRNLAGHMRVHDREGSLVSSRELAVACGASYRQIDYWDRHGILQAVQPARGSGTVRRFDAREVVVAWVVAQVLAVCAPGVERLHGLAAHVREHGAVGEYEFAPGIYVDLHRLDEVEAVPV